MDREQLLSQWKGEESRGMSGWDFSHIDGRYTADPLPWDYWEKVREFLRPGVRLLDMGTGGGELLLTLGHPYELTSVTEGWAPNLELCRKRLEPLGITVREYDSERGMPLPFEDNSFDLVINRPESYDLSEVRRVLKSNGFFLTQQVGGREQPPADPPAVSWFSWKLCGFLPGKRAAQIPGGRIPGDEQSPGLWRGTLPGCGSRGVSGQRVSLGISRFFRGPLPKGSASAAGPAGAPGLYSHPGAPLSNCGQNRK